MFRRRPERKLRRTQPCARVLALQSNFLRELKHIALLLCCCSLPIYVYVLTIPEEQRLITLTEKLKEVNHKEQYAVGENDRISREISAYRENPEYIELMARDYLNYYKKGETVIRLERP